MNTQTIRKYTPHTLFIVALGLSILLFLVVEKSIYTQTENEQLVEIISTSYCQSITDVTHKPTIDYNQGAVTIDCGKKLIIITPASTWIPPDYNADAI